MLLLQEYNIDFLRYVILIAPLLWASLAILFFRPGKQELAGAFIASLWNFSLLIPMNMMAKYFGWWAFYTESGLFFGLPIDVMIGWAIFWGASIFLLLRGKDILLAIISVLSIDLIFMPQLTNLFTLGSNWFVGEFFVLMVCFIPGWLIASFTSQGIFVNFRALAQAIITAFLIFIFLPAALLEQAGRSIFEIMHWSQFKIVFFLNLIGIPIILGLAGNQEFAERGNGTPIPFDPPKTLVNTGPYAYLGNPMQLSVVVYLMLAAIFYESIAVLSAAIMAVVYCLGIVRSHHAIDLLPRFGKSWIEYRGRVPYWFPTWKPWIKKASIIYFARSCGICSDTERWLASQKPSGLIFMDISKHKNQINRVTYRYPNSKEVEGVYAISSAMNHINFAFALFGWAMRLPLIRQFLQLILDIAGERADTTSCNAKQNGTKSKKKYKSKRVL